MLEGGGATECEVEVLDPLNPPLAYVAVKLVGVMEHCEERGGARQDGYNAASKVTTRQRGREGYLL